MKISYSAPGRAGILGNPSDIYGGSVISCATPARNTCTIEEADEWDLPADTTLWDAAVKRLPTNKKYRVTWRSEVPRSSGLAGSTALLAATVACLTEVHEDFREFAELVRDIELREAGVVCGYQDAYMVVHGGMKYLNFEGKHPIDSGPLGRVKDVRLNGQFLLITTGVERLSGSVHGPIRDRWLAGEKEVVDAMEELADMADSAKNGLSINDLGHLMTRNFKIIQMLGGSGESIDRLVQDCLGCGAVSAKLAGAGLGGTVIALTEDPDDLQQRLTEMGYTKFLRPVADEGLRKEA
ncbi:MAG: hypothetical protein JST12_04125 [Armatimonadetes bacterium]|nr:hypothetical protein [Armatimonadota bacterium]